MLIFSAGRYNPQKHQETPTILEFLDRLNLRLVKYQA